MLVLDLVSHYGNARAAFDLGKFLFRAGQADLEALSLTGPTLTLGLAMRATS